MDSHSDQNAQDVYVTFEMQCIVMLQLVSNTNSITESNEDVVAESWLWN